MNCARVRTRSSQSGSEVNDEIGWLRSLISSDVVYNATGIRYTLEDIDNLAKQLQERIKRQRGTTQCSDSRARYTAACVLVNHVCSTIIASGIRTNKQPGAARKLQRELDRFSRSERPQDAALKVSDPANLYITQALSAHGNSELISKWCGRGALTTRAERIELIKRIAPFASAAIEKVQQLGHVGGRHSDHACETFIAGTAHILHSMLRIDPKANRKTHCRQLIAVCANFCNIHRENLSRPDYRSELAEHAIKKLESNHLRFSHVMIGRRIDPS